MKTIRFLLPFALGLLAAGSARAFDPVKGLPRVDVVFTEADKFTDVRDGAFGDSESGRNAILGELRDYFVKQAGRLLAPGQMLKITVTDVDLAGEYEPWRGPQWDNVRIVKDIYPPTIKLAFQLTGADGQVLKKGDRVLRDLAFMMTLSIDRNDSRRYEKALIDDWLREEFRGLKNQ